MSWRIWRIAVKLYEYLPRALVSVRRKKNENIQIFQNTLVGIWRRKAKPYFFFVRRVWVKTADKKKKNIMDASPTRPLSAERFCLVKNEGFLLVYQLNNHREKQRWRSGESSCLPSFPRFRPGALCGLGLLSAFTLLRGFFSRFSGFLSPKNQHFQIPVRPARIEEHMNTS